MPATLAWGLLNTGFTAKNVTVFREEATSALPAPIGIWRCCFLWNTGEPREKPSEQGEN